VNQKAAAVQKILDEKQNLHISPAIAAFPAERVRKAAHSLEDTTVSEDVLRRRAENAVANIAASFHDDYIKENSEFRQKAGLTCHVSRIGAFKCCAWCARLAGRYEKGREPADFWKRHDKCTCQISYETQKLRQRLSGNGNGWKVDAEVRRRQNAAKIEYKPTRFTPEQAAALERQQLSQYRGLTIPGKTGIMKNIELPPETYKISSMSEETRQQIAKAFDKLNSEYNIQLDELLTMPLKPEEKNVPFQFQPIRGENGELIKRIVINSDYNFNDTQEEFQARIMRNFNRGVLASNSVAGLIAHETAHVMTFQDISTFSGYLIQNKNVAKQIVYGISGYADAMGDGAECIAEAFAAKQCGQSISEDAQALLDKFIERWHKL
jgi:cell pole-organizing protein PopZ